MDLAFEPSIQELRQRMLAEIPYVTGIRFTTVAPTVLSVTLTYQEGTYQINDTRTFPTNPPLDSQWIAAMLETCRRAFLPMVHKHLDDAWLRMRKDEGWLMICHWDGYEKRFPCPLEKPPHVWKELFSLPVSIDFGAPIKTDYHITTTTIALRLERLDPIAKVAWYSLPSPRALNLS